MGAIHQHAGAVDRGDDVPAERRKRDVVVIAAAADRIVAVVGQVDLADAEIMEQLNHFDPLAQRHAALKIERYRQLARRLGAHDVGGFIDGDEQIGPGGDLGAKAGQRGQDLRQRVHVHADIDRYEIDPGAPVPVQHAEIGIRVQGQAGVAVPDERRVRRARSHHSLPI